MDEIVQENKVGAIFYDDALWKGFNPEAKDLLTHMTIRDVKKRISAKECLEHKWLNMEITKTTHLPVPDVKTSIMSDR